MAVNRYAILERDGFRCRYCGAPAPDARLHVDHIIPRSHGGSDDESNLATSCQPCNSSKRDRMPLRYYHSPLAHLYPPAIETFAKEVNDFDEYWQGFDRHFNIDCPGEKTWVEERPDDWREVVADLCGHGFVGECMRTIEDDAIASSWGHNYAWHMYVGVCRAIIAARLSVEIKFGDLPVYMEAAG